MHKWEDKMEETISLKELYQVIKKRLNIILICTVIAIAVSSIVSFFMLTPIYQVSTQLLVNKTKDEQTTYSTNEVQTNLQLINTYNVIIKSPAILDIVIKDLDLSMTTSDLYGKITVESEQNSQVVNLSVQDADPHVAAKIANKIAEVFETKISEIMNIDNVSVLAQAVVTDGQSPIKPQPMLNIAIALILGLMVGVGLAFLFEYLDNTIKTEQDIEKLLGLPVLGVITTIEGSNGASVKSRLNRKVTL